MVKPSQPFRGSKAHWAIYLIILWVFVCFLPTLQNGFVWDDGYNIVENFSYRGLSLSHLYWMFTTFHDGNYHPLCWLTLGFDFVLWDMHPAGYHLTNLVLHVLNSVLFYFLIMAFLQRMPVTALYVKPSGIQMSAAIGALFFAIHPLRVEPVAWVSTRGDVLCGFFYLLTVIAYLRMIDNKQTANRKKRYFLSVFFFALSLLSRAWGITLPVVLLILDIYPLRRFVLGRQLTPIPKRLLIEKIPFALLALSAGILAFWAKKESMLPLTQHGAIDRFVQATYGLCFYPWKTVAPFRLSPLYLLNKTFHYTEPEYILYTLLVIGITVWLIFMRHRWPWAITAWVCYALIVSPLLGFVQSGPQIVADRYTYLSCLPFGILIGAGGFRLWIKWQKKELTAAKWYSFIIAILVGLLLLSVRSFYQIRVWHDNRSFWDHVLKVDPAHYLAYFNRGFLRQEQRDLAGAMADYNAAIRLNPEYTDAYINRGVLRRKQRDLTGAMADCNAAIRLNPENPNAYINRAYLRQEQRDLAGAMADYNAAIRLNPENADIRNNRGLLRKEQGDFAGAVTDFNMAIRLDPFFPEAYANRGLVWQAQNDAGRAIEDFTKALAVASAKWPHRAQVEQLLANVRARLKEQNKSNER